MRDKIIIAMDKKQYLYEVPSFTPGCQHVYNIVFRQSMRLFVCGVSLTSGQLIIELFIDCLKVMLFTWAVTESMR